MDETLKNGKKTELQKVLDKKNWKDRPMGRDTEGLLEAGKGGCFLEGCFVTLPLFPVTFGQQLRGSV